MINDLKLDGYISKIFRSGTSQNGTRYLSFGLKHITKGGQAYYSCVAFNDCADHLADLPQGVPVILCGRYDVKSTKDKSGVWTTQHQVVVNRFEMAAMMTEAFDATHDVNSKKTVVEPIVQQSDTFKKKFEELKQSAFDESDVPF